MVLEGMGEGRGASGVGRGGRGEGPLRGVGGGAVRKPKGSLWHPVGTGPSPRAVL